MTLTPEEIAQILKVETRVIIDLLEKGTIRGFKIADDWRILQTDFEAYLVSTIKDQQEQILIKTLQDPSFWADKIADNPSLRIQISEGDFPEDSMGEFLKNALRERENKRNPGKQSQT